MISIIHEDNEASIRVAEKNDMKPIFKTVFLEMKTIVYGVYSNK